ncbi:MAG: 2OG-Fe(II) oxygenase [Bdellovibrionota bacterium]
MKLRAVYPIGNAKVRVFDGVFGAKAAGKIADAALRVPRSWKREPRFKFHRILDTDAFARHRSTRLLDEAARRLIARFYPKSVGHPLSYPAINRIGSHDTSDVHADDTHCPDCLACLLFANERWDPQWGGELVLFDEHQEALFSVTPKPGRIVIYPASLFHRAGVPQADCPVSRITVGVWYRCRARPSARKPL